VTGQWFSPGPLVSSTNKTYHHYIIEILLKVGVKLHETKSNQSNVTNEIKDSEKKVLIMVF
jgi:hypothetical protein